MPSKATNRAIGYAAAIGAGAIGAAILAKTVAGAPPGPGDVTTSLTLGTNPDPNDAGTPVTASGQLTRDDTAAGVAGAGIRVEKSRDQVTWTVAFLATTDANGAYSGLWVPSSGITFVRARYLGAPLTLP